MTDVLPGGNMAATTRRWQAARRAIEGHANRYGFSPIWERGRARFHPSSPKDIGSRSPQSVRGRDQAGRVSPSPVSMEMLSGFVVSLSAIARTTVRLQSETLSAITEMGRLQVPRAGSDCLGFRIAGADAERDVLVEGPVGASDKATATRLTKCIVSPFSASRPPNHWWAWRMTRCAAQPAL